MTQPIAWLGQSLTDDEEGAALARYRALQAGRSDPTTTVMLPGAPPRPSRRMPLSMWLASAGACGIAVGLAGVIVWLLRANP